MEGVDGTPTPRRTAGAPGGGRPRVPPREWTEAARRARRASGPVVGRITIIDRANRNQSITRSFGGNSIRTRDSPRPARLTHVVGLALELADARRGVLELEGGPLAAPRGRGEEARVAGPTSSRGLRRGVTLGVRSRSPAPRMEWGVEGQGVPRREWEGAPGLQRGEARVGLRHRRRRPGALRPRGGEPRPQRRPLRRPPRLGRRAGTTATGGDRRPSAGG